MTKEVEFTYQTRVSNSGTINVTVSAHMVALLISEKLGLPMPMRGETCRIRADGGVTGFFGNTGPSDQTVDLTYIYEAVPTEGPVTLKLPGKPDDPQE